MSREVSIAFTSQSIASQIVSSVGKTRVRLNLGAGCRACAFTFDARLSHFGATAGLGGDT